MPYSAFSHVEVASDLLERVGNTPLFRLRKITRDLPESVEVYAKAEWFNPGGSVKDRAALSMILHGEQSGRLAPGKIILDATSGNTGIAYAMIGAARGYRVRLCISANVSQERKRILNAYGAEIIFTDPEESSDGAIKKARELYARSPELYFYPDQYNNPANWQAHYRTTGPELLQQTRGRITHFVAGLGTSGTLMGTARRLKEYNPAIRIVSVQPDSGFHGLEGLKHMGTAMVPGIYDPGLADQEESAGTEESYEMVRRIAREEGLLVGISSGAAAACALRVAAQLEAGVVVVLFADSGDKYLSSELWSGNE
jgi:cysteine synthase B